MADNLDRLRYELDKYHEEMDYEFSYHGVSNVKYRIAELREWWRGPIEIIAGRQAYARAWCDIYEETRNPNLFVEFSGIEVERDPDIWIDYFGVIPVIQ